METQHAWYILNTPSPAFRTLYTRFYKLHRSLQKVIADTLSNIANDSESKAEALELKRKIQDLASVRSLLYGPP